MRVFTHLTEMDDETIGLRCRATFETLKWNLMDERIEGFRDAKVGSAVRAWVADHQPECHAFLQRTNTLTAAPDDAEILCFALIRVAVCALILDVLLLPKNQGRTPPKA